MAILFYKYMHLDKIRIDDQTALRDQWERDDILISIRKIDKKKYGRLY